MILQCGGYRHAQDECEVVRMLDREIGPGGEIIKIRRSWQISGQLQAADYLTLQVAKAVLEAAYAQPYPDMILWHNDQATVHDSILNAGSTSGVRVISGPNYPTGKGAQGGTFIDYTVSVEATYEAAVANTELLESFQETVSESGGGRRIVVVDTVDDDPVPQLLNRRTKYKYTQSGQAVGRFGYPPPPPPNWPGWENEAERSITRVGPRREGRNLTGYSVSWSYVFESPEPLEGLPNVWVF
jgi:hypothetical protein